MAPEHQSNDPKGGEGHGTKAADKKKQDHRQNARPAGRTPPAAKEKKPCDQRQAMLGVGGDGALVENRRCVGDGAPGLPGEPVGWGCSARRADGDVAARKQLPVSRPRPPLVPRRRD